MKALLIQLEFFQWHTARPWTYPMHAGLVRALEQWGMEVVAVPAIPELAAFPSANWLTKLRRLYDNTSFDQVWLWLLHYPYSPEFLAWVKTVAPVRIGLLAESMRYDEQTIRRYPSLAERPGLVLAQCEALTHVLACDEADAAELGQRLGIPTMWLPGVVPQAHIVTPDSRPKYTHAVFHGAAYGDREFLLHHPVLAGKLQFAQAPSSAFPKLFDDLQRCMAHGLARGEFGTTADLTQYVKMLHQLRYGEFMQWIAELRTWPVVVNLPTLAKFYGGRVFEAMAAGRPVVSWAIPDRPLNRALFEDGQEIVLFESGRIQDLADRLEWLLSNRAAAQDIAMKAQSKLREHHTLERRVEEIQRWIRSTDGTHTASPEPYDQHGKPHTLEIPSRRILPPDSGAPAEAGAEVVGSAEPERQAAPMADVTRSSIRTTVFVLTVDDLTFPACMESLRRQRGITFILDVIRGYRPMSAALQEMLHRCRTPYAVQVDEDMILSPEAIQTMETVMSTMPQDVGMVCFHLFDEDLGRAIQGIKIYRIEPLKDLQFGDVMACEMDFLEQLTARGLRWALHDKILGKHGTAYTPESIYRRYKSMYEKDIREWNVVTTDLRRKAERYRATGDPLQLFALLGAMDGLVSAPFAEDREKDAARYLLKQLEVLQRVMNAATLTIPYEPSAMPKRRPIPPLQLSDNGGVSSPLSYENNRRDPNDSVADTVPTQAHAASTIGKQANHHRKKILLVTPFFPPSVGGVEIMAENLGIQLAEHGYDVEIATTALPQQRQRAVNALTVHALSMGTQQERIDALDRLQSCMESGEYRACLMVSDPRHPFFKILAADWVLPDSTSLIILPQINQYDYAEWKHDATLQTVMRAGIQKARSIVSLTRDGLISEIVRRFGGDPQFLPNATSAFSGVDGQAFRRQWGFEADDFVIVHLANLLPIKNQLGLLEALEPLPRHWRVMLIGYPPVEDPAAQGYAQTVIQRCSELPQVRYIHGLPHDQVGKALAAADVVVLPSKAEIAPVTILEAMSLHRPWVATPSCGACWDYAGGIIAELEQFSQVLEVLDQHPELRDRLGQAGYRHWRACYRWERVVEEWINLIEYGQVQARFEMPEEVVRAMNDLARDFGTQLQRQGPGLEVSSANGEALQRSSDIVTSQSSTIACRDERVTTSGRVDLGLRGGVSPSIQTTNDQGDHFQETQFYIELFVRNPVWSTPTPNQDEQARWTVIQRSLDLWNTLTRFGGRGPVRVLDVGCGRGWLTNLMQVYGKCDGVEPVGPVVEYARRLFPQITFYACYPDQLIRMPDFEPYDLVVSSEVIEHVPDENKPAFVATLKRLLKPKGWLILSTPRGEVFEQWSKVSPPNQPVEDWIREIDLLRLVEAAGFEAMRCERIYFNLETWTYLDPAGEEVHESTSVIPLYQVWAFRLRSSVPARIDNDALVCSGATLRLSSCNPIER
ncbi:MAG: glycosyltransferase [Nitrospirae bacterium]|nr:MAG: glycosyltransferase [Nitrospirota bacterium]